MADPTSMNDSASMRDPTSMNDSASMGEREALLREIGKHCDLQERLGLLPPSARARGLFFGNIDNSLVNSGKHELYRAMFPERRSTMLWYPLSDYLQRMAIAGALLCGPERVHQGMSQIGRSNAISFSESLLGRMMVRLLSRDPKKLLRQGVAAHRQGLTHGKWTLEITGERSATMTMREEYVYIESHYVGAAEGTFEAVGLRVNVTVELDDRFNGRHLLSW